MIDLIKLVSEAIAASVFWVSVQPVGLPELKIPVTNRSIITLQVSTNLIDWTKISPNFESEIWTNGFSEEIVPFSWHFETNIIPTTNVWLYWDPVTGLSSWKTNDNPVTYINIIVDEWKTNLNPKISWRSKHIEQTNVKPPFVFYRLK